VSPGLTLGHGHEGQLRQEPVRFADDVGELCFDAAAERLVVDLSNCVVVDRGLPPAG
jgi:hypothetical protein